MNNGFDFKLTIDPKDKYEKARKDLIQAMISVQDLPQNQQKQLAIELFGAKAINDFIGFIKSYKKF